VVPGADHFFAGHLDELERAIVDHISDSGFVPSPAESSPT
jgi:alpha/beta superfamily hydrolase